MEQNTFKVKDIIKEAYHIAEENLWNVVGLFATVFFVGIVLSILAGSSMLLGILVSTLVSIVSIHVAMSFIKKEKFSFESLFDTLKLRSFVYYLIASFLVTFFVFLGLALLVIPGIIICTMLVFVKYLILYKNMKPMEALRESRRLTKGIRMNIFILMLAFLGINILGLIAFGIGLLFTVPMTIIAFLLLYKKITDPVGVSVV